MDRDMCIVTSSSLVSFTLVNLVTGPNTVNLLEFKVGIFESLWVYYV